MSYSHMIPSLILAYAAGEKLRAFSVTIDIGLLSPLELLGSLILPFGEIGIAVLLIALASPAIVIAAFSLFSCYTAFLLHLLWQGESDCGCIGSVLSSARLVLFIDVGCLGLLAHSGIVSARYRSRALASFILCAVPLFTVLWGLSPITVIQVRAALDPGPLRSRFQHADRTPVSSSFETKVKVWNRTRRNLDIKEIFVSCGCVNFEPKTFSLAPGASTELRLTIDLTRAYTDIRQKVARHVITAAFYDSEMLPIDELTIFEGNSFRDFAVLPGKIAKIWAEDDKNSVELSIRRFNQPQQSVDVFLNGQFKQSSIDESVRVTLDRPRSIFGTQTIRISSAGIVGSSIEIDVSVFATPQPITWVKNIDNNGELGQQDEKAAAFVSAQLLTDSGTHSSNVNLWNINDLLVLDNSHLEQAVAGYLLVEFDAGDGIMQRLVYPVFNTKRER